VTSGGTWRGVFLADMSAPDRTTVYLAREGRLVVDRGERSVVIELTGVSRHTTLPSRPEEYEGGEQERVLLALDPNTVLPRLTLVKGPPEMTIAELRASIEEAARRGEPAHLQQFMIGQKFSIPFATVVLALIGLSLGVSHRKDGRLASFVLGFGVIFIYYVVFYTARAAAISGRLPGYYAPWIPNLVFAAAGVALLRWRAGAADETLRIGIPTFWRRAVPAEMPPASPADRARTRRRVAFLIDLSRLHLPRPALLDLYVSGQYLRVFLLGVCSLLGMFYIATFMDLADKLFRGTATTGLLLRYFYFETPQFVYYVIPIAVLVATLVTIGAMTRNSEIIVMRACGVSLYRTAAPLVLFGALSGAVLVGLQERVLASSNRQADRLNREIRGLRLLNPFDRRWMVGQTGDIYHYDDFDQERNTFSQLTVYHLDPEGLGLGTVTFAARAVHAGAGEWQAADGWSREFQNGAGTGQAAYASFEARSLWLEAPAYFKTDEPDPDQMTFTELRDHVARLQSRGDDATSSRVWLQRKAAFPLVAFVMTLIAVPFAVTTGRRGALYGIGIGIVLAILYWLMLSVLGAVGVRGLLSPVLAAWTPNILFSAAAVYMLLTVRT
jgi:LPS export ABC transporter permease LptG